MRLRNPLLGFDAGQIHEHPYILACRFLQHLGVALHGDFHCAGIDPETANVLAAEVTT